jgi:hypothetical protein
LKNIGINKIEKLNSSKINDVNYIKLEKKSKEKIYEIYDIDYKKFNYKKDMKEFFVYK